MIGDHFESCLYNNNITFNQKLFQKPFFLRQHLELGFDCPEFIRETRSQKKPQTTKGGVTQKINLWTLATPICRHLGNQIHSRSKLLHSNKIKFD